MWTDNYCFGPERGATRVYDRETGRITEFMDATLLPVSLNPNGLLVAGEGAEVLVDIASQRFVATVLENLFDLSWSPDFRYASYAELLLAGGGSCDGVPP